MGRIDSIGTKWMLRGNRVCASPAPIVSAGIRAESKMVLAENVYTAFKLGARVDHAVVGS